MIGLIVKAVLDAVLLGGDVDGVSG